MSGLKHCLRFILTSGFLVMFITTALAVGWKSEKNPEELNADGLKFFQSGQWEKAVDNFTRALEQRPDDLKIRYNLALMYYKVQRYVLSRDQALKILRSNPRHKNALSLYVASIEGIRTTPGGEDADLVGKLPDFLNEKGEVRSERIPAEVTDLLKANYVQQDFNFIWENLASEVQALTPKSAFVRSSGLAYKNEMKESRALDLEVTHFESSGPYGVAKFHLLLENPANTEIREILGGEERFRVRVHNYMFFHREGDKWKMYPITVFGKTLAECYKRFPGLFVDTGAEIQWKALWFDRNHFFLDRFEKMWRRRDPARATNAAIARTVYEYLDHLKKGKYEDAVKLLAATSRSRYNAVKLEKMPLYRNIYQMEIGNVQTVRQIALCEFRMENLNIDLEKDELSLTRLSSGIFLVYEDGFWKIIEHDQRRDFLEKSKNEIGELRVSDDQFAYFNGRDWIDASAEFRKRQSAGEGK